MAVGVNFADLKVYVVIFRILGSDGDAGHGVVGQVVSGGEGLSVISGKIVIGILALLQIADQGDRHRRRFHRLHGRIDGADQYLTGAAVVRKADLDQDLFPCFTFGQRVCARVHADVGLEGDPVGVVPLPLIGEHTGQTIRVTDVGGRGGQGLPDLCDAADVRRTRRHIVHGANIDRDGVFGVAVLRSVVDLEQEARVGHTRLVEGWGILQPAVGQVGGGYRLRQF